LRLRIQQVKRVMRPSALIFVHCDRNAVHHIRLLLDELFGEERFLAEIIWAYRRWSNARKNLLPAHQTILMYSRSPDYTFNTLTRPYSQATNLDQILQRRERDADGKTVYAEDGSGEVILNGPKKGVPLSDVWEIPYLNPKARERTGYPTQKPILLLERIIEVGSNPGDTVLDPFCGSGTTLVAASLLGRHFIGIDRSADAIALCRERLENPIKSTSNVLDKGRSTYENLPDYVQHILQTLPVKPVQRNAGIDAIHDTFLDGKPIVLRVQRRGEPLTEAAQKLHYAGQRKRAARMVLIQTEDTEQQSFTDMMPAEVTVIPDIHFSLIAALEENRLHSET
jgi:site-specific DNA-methyltransferase (adenine-specific)